MDWYEDDLMRKRWEGVTRAEEKIMQRKTEGNALHKNVMQRVPELEASQRITTGNVLKKKEKKERWQDGLLEKWMRKRAARMQGRCTRPRTEEERWKCRKGESKTMENSWVQMSDKRHFQQEEWKAEVRFRSAQQ